VCSERGHLFYTPGFTVPESWNQPELEDLWEKIQPLQSSLNQIVADQNIQEFGVTLEVPTYLYTILKVHLIILRRSIILRGIQFAEDATQ
jgi:hypothetical protein